MRITKYAHVQVCVLFNMVTHKLTASQEEASESLWILVADDSFRRQF